MGAWDETSFGNDTAADWSYGLEETDDLDYIESTLDEVIEAGEDEIDADTGAEGIAAAEAVARLMGNWGERTSYTEAMDTWIEAHPLKPSASLVRKAIAALDRVGRSPSELRDLWEESDLEGWEASIAELRSRLE